MLKYGTDKPDLRNPLIIPDVTSHFEKSGFGLFEKIVGCGRRGARDPGAGDRREEPQVLRRHERLGARAKGIAGLGYVTRKGGEFGGPIAKNHGEEGMEALYAALGLGPDDGCSSPRARSCRRPSSPARARTRVGEQLGLIEQGEFKFCWIVDFPMFEYDEDAKKVDFSHNPFSMPQGELEALETMDPLDDQGLAVRHRLQRRRAVARARSATTARTSCTRRSRSPATRREEVDTNFAGMINAFKFGAPPHGGSAPGVDRIVMLLADEPNIREVIVFPMNQKAEDLMMGAPGDGRPQAAARAAHPPGRAAEGSARPSEPPQPRGLTAGRRPCDPDEGGGDPRRIRGTSMARLRLARATLPRL